MTQIMISMNLKILNVMTDDDERDFKPKNDDMMIKGYLAKVKDP